MLARHPVTPRKALLLVLLWGGLCVAGGACGPAGRNAGNAAIGPDEGAFHPMVGRAAPDFTAQDASGAWLPKRSMQDRPLALLLFRPGAPMAADLARALSGLRDDPAYAPTVFLGLGRGSLEDLKRFTTSQRITLPVLRDPGTIAPAYGVGELPAVVLVDKDGIVRFRLDGFLGARYQPRLEAMVAFLRGFPTLAATAGRPLDLDYTRDPKAPLFAARDLDGRPIDLAALAGKVVVLDFFDQECPHCQKDFPRLVPALREFRSRGVVAIGVTSRDVGGTLRDFLREGGIDFPVIVDRSREIFAKYDSSRTPDLFFIDRGGFIRFHEAGDRPDRAELTRLQLRLLLGDEPRALAAALPAGRFSGDATCRACHLREYRDWLLTPHSLAWDSLAAGDKWRDPECVRCHVTGVGQDGGFADIEATPHMVNVQCEICHGAGGGHAGSADAASGAGATGIDPQAMAKLCSGCHTGKFVLNFDVDEALALVAHRDRVDLDKLFRYSDEQRQRLEVINTRRLEKFKSGVAFVGAGACRDCHRKEYDQWSRTPHAAAFARLLKVEREADRTCQPCHTTGFGHPGGFGDAAVTVEMTNVQCEVCHGPGADHIKAAPALRKATIYGITDQCSFCIIQGVCVTCHDAADDPDFSIESALPLVRH